MRIKKIAVVALGLMVSVGAHAQFESGKQYCGASLTGLNLSYNGSEELNLGIQAKAGYFFEDDMIIGPWALRADIISSRMVFIWGLA